MEYARLAFNEDGTPVSTDFDDVYFSQGQGQAETHHVFIAPNNLIARFQSLSEFDHFTIAETGFGTGLNFFVAAQLFLEFAPKTARLNFVSCEKFPIEPSDLFNITKPWAEFTELSQQLIKQYPPGLNGFHCIEFERIELLLMLGDAQQTYSELTAKVDAWFLDGFSPKKNPDMWQPSLFKHIARLSKPNATLATFTSARQVRDGLSAVGFHLEKQSGFGLKREMLSGVFRGFIGPTLPTGWPCSELPTPSVHSGKRVAIVGAGIAGATTALELTKRGYSVTVYESANAPAQGGSGNTQGAIYAKLSAQLNTATQFYSQALLLAQRRLQQCSKAVEHGVSGLVQLAHDEREHSRLDELKNSIDIPESIVKVINASELSQKTGMEIAASGAWFENGGWVNPLQWVNEILTLSGCDVVCNTRITSLSTVNKTWRLVSHTGEQFHADHVVLTTAHDTTNFEQTAHLPLKPIAGQITKLTNATAQKLKAVICTDRYIMPAVNGVSTIGSTFRLKSVDTKVTDEDHNENITSLTERIPALTEHETKIISGRSGVRCTTPDYLPMVGGISDAHLLSEQFRIPLQRNVAHKEKPAQITPGLWVNIGHGSKGLCSSHLCAKLIATLISDEPQPVQASVQKSVNPNRFVVRSLLREKRKKLKR